MLEIRGSSRQPCPNRRELQLYLRLKIGDPLHEAPRSIGGLAALTLPLGVTGAALAEGTATPSGSGLAREIVAREVAAFNAHDATTVTKLHASSAALKIIPSGTALFSGADESQAFFTKLFKDNPNIHLTLDKQYVFKNLVINHYNVSGGTGNELISIYDVQNDVIANEWAIFG